MAEIRTVPALTIRQRRNAKPRRPLYVEPLENRMMLAASIGASLEASPVVILSTNLDSVAPHRGWLATIIPEARASTTPAPGSVRLLDLPIRQPQEHDEEQQSRLRQILFASLPDTFLATEIPDRFDLQIRPHDGPLHSPFAPEFTGIEDDVPVIANFDDSREEADETAIPMSGQIRRVTFESASVDSAITAVADELWNAARQIRSESTPDPNQDGPTIRTRVGSTDKRESGSTLRSLIEDGMIDLQDLQSASDLNELSAGRIQMSWQLDAGTIERIHSAVVAAPQAPAATETPVVPRQSDEGGMIKIAGSALPTSTPAPQSRPIRVQLDQSMGHFRNFRLAATPGHDEELEDVLSLTLTSRWSGDDSDQDTDSSSIDSLRRPLSRMNVSSAAFVVAGGILMTVDRHAHDESVAATSED